MMIREVDLRKPEGREVGHTVKVKYIAKAESEEFGRFLPAQIIQ